MQHKHPRWIEPILLIGLFVFFSGAGMGVGHPPGMAVAAAESSDSGNWPPPGKAIICPITRDTSLSSVDEERLGNNGGAARLKLKSQQEFILFDIDPQVLRGKIVTGALLHLRSASPREARMCRLGVSSLAGDWVEGSGRRYRAQKGSACFDMAQYKQKYWTYKDSTVMDAVFGCGHTIWRFADCTPPDPNGWQACAVDPTVIAARTAGLSYGFALYDEVGSTWSLEKGKFTYNYFPNRRCYAREKSASGPWMEIWVDGEDGIPPGPVTAVRVDAATLPSGEAMVSWETPRDAGGGKTIGFVVEYEQNGVVKALPRYLIPLAGPEGGAVSMHVRDIELSHDQPVHLIIRAVDSAGNVGPPTRQSVPLAKHVPVFPSLPPFISPFPHTSQALSVEDITVSVIDCLDKIDPVSGEMIPLRKTGYLKGNHLLDVNNRGVRLFSARNETVFFQVNIDGHAPDFNMVLAFDDGDIKTTLWEFAYVRIKNKPKSMMPDPLRPFSGPCSLPSARSKTDGGVNNNHSFLGEIHIPHGISSGMKNGKLIITAGQEQLELRVTLTVWDFTLPNKLSFVPEMNCYGHVHPNRKGYEFYRLAHKHRVCLNRVPYNWNGRPAFAPEWDGNRFRWDGWDQKVGPLLDGSIFKDLPRAGEPVDSLYLPFNENWPVSIFDSYTCSYWANEAFSNSYKDELQDAFGAFARHCAEKKWQDTTLHFYLNNKVYYRRQYGKSSAPWLFDEPVNTQDFWAIRWYGLQWQGAVRPYKEKTRLWYRGDVSYGQFARNMLGGIMDVEYMGGNNVRKTRVKHDEKRRFNRSYFFEYGTANKIDESNLQPVLWCVSAWTKGAMGVLPWQSIGSKRAWKNAEQTALFYPHPDGPQPSLRLKAFTRGQQLVEYLTLFEQIYALPRNTVSDWVKDFLSIDGEVRKTTRADAGTIRFKDIDIQDLWRMRYALGELISQKGPPYKRALVDFESPEFEPGLLPEIGYAHPAPPVEPCRPECDGFYPNGMVHQ